MNELYKRIEALCLENGKKIAHMCADTGIRSGVLSDLKMGRSKSLSAATLAKIASYFNVSLDYLLGNEAKIDSIPIKDNKPEITFDDFTYALYNESKELTKENKDKLLEMARIFKLSQQAKKAGENRGNDV